MILQGAGQGEGQMRLRIIGKEKRTEIISWVKKNSEGPLFLTSCKEKGLGGRKGKGEPAMVDAGQPYSLSTIVQTIKVSICWYLLYYPWLIFPRSLRVS